MKKTLALLALSALTYSVQAQHQLEKLWESTEQLPVPESVLPHPAQSTLLVSLIDGGGSEKDGKGGVAVLHADGKMKDATWVSGLHAPKGMAMHGNRLYIADITDVVVVDMANGKVLKKIPVAGATFLNDVTADAMGRVFVSDTREHKVYLIENDQASVYLEEANNANGVRVIGEALYVLAGKELWKVDQAKNKTVITKDLEEGGDGLEPVGNGDFLVTCWPGLIYYIKANGTVEKLLDVRGKMNTADLGFDAKTKTLYIPTFNNNSVVAYKLVKK
ncbi:SMP-30/gluconolactonase/LRE family protein [Sphingobacterium corticibacter]|uniref:ATP-binding protein n=1 Tax=Sphingobacterium corticibacter TaxID=2171749 RepID=A0A2T8HJX2_9SPHI|nr:ATP-binding protein [Sphingobacterium corticibacter]PVH25756.1 ATP-binding protein [Sphingobacterium corticibacter]